MHQINWGTLVFYILCLLSISILVVGAMMMDMAILGVAIGIFICAVLVKYEFNLDIKFWQNID